MHTVEILEQALDALGQLGYAIRQEWFAGRGGGACEIRGRKLVFLDLDLTPADQLEQALGVLRMNPAVESLDLSPSLRALLPLRKSA
jgi:hypothetical protein